MAGSRTYKFDYNLQNAKNDNLIREHFLFNENCDEIQSI